MSDSPLLDIHLYGLAATGPAGYRQLPSRRVAIVNAEAVDASQFDMSFDQMSAALLRLERMFLEPDGSFVWSGQTAGERWQVDGMLYDHHERVQRVEFKGSCPWDAWQVFLAAVGYPQQPLTVHWLAYHCFVEVDTLTHLWRPS